MKFRHLPNVLAVIAVAAAVWLAHREIAGYSIEDIGELLFGYSPGTVLMAIALTLVGYCVLASYDRIALLHLGRQLPLRQVVFAGFVSFAVSNNAGHALVSGGSLRYRFYSGWGLNGIEIAQIVLFSTVTYFLAVGTLASISYLLAPDSYFDQHVHIGDYIHWVMWAVMALLVGYWLLVLSGRKQWRWREHEITLPGAGITLAQTLIGCVDLLLAAAVLYVLLNEQIDVSFSAFLNAYLLAQVLGLFSQVPGGIGVFEGAFLYLYSGHQQTGEIIAALLLYRVIYYLVPLVVAVLSLLVHEIRQREVLKRRLVLPFMILQQAVPQILSLLMLFAGAMLLLSGNTPGDDDRLEWLNSFLSLPVIEVSHLMGSIVGLLLIVLARAVRLKLNAAYYAVAILLVLGVVASLAKGFDYEEAMALMVVLALLLPAKSHFYRQSRLVDAALTPQWILIVAGVFGLMIWLGFFAYRHIEYSHELWWQFALDGDASRFLRSTLVVSVIAVAMLFYYLFTRSHYRPRLPDQAELDEAEKCVRLSSDSNHFLALSGDKYLLWSDDRRGFISYVTTPKYWISIGDPCGSAEVCDELLWKFREEADRFGARVAFYRVGLEILPQYIDLGLTMVKLGEEARVELAGFGLQGQARASMRHRYNKMQREQWDFAVVPRAGVAGILDELEIISEQWLHSKNTREKGISLGFFDRAYLMRNDVAVIRQGEKIVAFANLWQTDNREELSIDLMRYSDDAPTGTMEYLTICLMLWGKDQGYHWFNLGMAPLSGLDQNALAPLWQKIGSSVFRYGNEFYNFQGLRLYKDKFLPRWEPSYLAVPSSYDVPSVLINVTTLIAGGIKGVFSK